MAQKEILPADTTKMKNAKRALLTFKVCELVTVSPNRAELSSFLRFSHVLRLKVRVERRWRMVIISMSHGFDDVGILTTLEHKKAVAHPRSSKP